jgi:putative ABC transport system substrate-binding protein
MTTMASLLSPFRSPHRRPAIAALLLGLVFSVSGQAQELSVAVLYPEVRDPYRGVFLEIVRGIETELKQPVRPYLLKSGEDAPPSLIERLKADGIDVVVSLGQAGLSAAKPISAAFPVVIGAVFVSPDQEIQGISGISLTPDPDVLFDRLKALVPGVREVTVIYDPRQKAWEIARAQSAAEVRGLKLKALPAEDLYLSAQLFRETLLEIRDDSIAIWLPQNNAAMDEATLLPVVLKGAWDKQFVVFSSNLDHVRKGALFSLYPDNFRMGRSLAVMARTRARSGAPQGAGIEPLRDLLIAVNLRTAERLGLNLAHDATVKFDLTFPQPQ